MKRYVIRRLLSLIPILIIVSVVVFSMIHMIPGDPARAILGDQATEEEIQALRESMGFNEPLARQYLSWLSGVLHGDIGDSIFINQPMWEIIIDHLIPTLQLTLLAMLVAVLVALPLGVLSACKKGRGVDLAVSVVTLLGISIPSFLLGLFMIMLFAVRLRWLPVAGYKWLSDGLAANLRYLAMPSLALGLMQAALITRMTKASMGEVLGSEYMRMARAKGVRRFALVWKHAFRNALIPVITTVGQSFTALLSGAAVIENVFNIPGIGQLVVNSAGRRDYEVIQATILVIAVLSVLVNLIVDILYAWANPRIDLE